jgi:peptide/nickel transport system permease protein
MMIPGILLVIVFVSALGISLKNLIISIGLTTVPHFTRVMRASVLQVRNSDFVESARAIGCSDLKIIFRHIIPNSLSSSIVYAATRLGSAMTDAAAFSFLGLGVPSPLPEWGALLADGRLFLREAAYLVAFPGLAIMITVLSVNLIGDGVRDALDPKLKR